MKLHLKAHAVTKTASLLIKAPQQFTTADLTVIASESGYLDQQFEDSCYAGMQSTPTDTTL